MLILGACTPQSQASPSTPTATIATAKATDINAAASIRGTWRVRYVVTKLENVSATALGLAIGSVEKRTWVVTPTCPAGPCDAKLAAADPVNQPGRVFPLAVLKYRAGRYTLSSPTTDNVNCLRASGTFDTHTSVPVLDRTDLSVSVVKAVSASGAVQAKQLRGTRRASLTPKPGHPECKAYAWDYSVTADWVSASGVAPTPRPLPARDASCAQESKIHSNQPEAGRRDELHHHQPNERSGERVLAQLHGPSPTLVQGLSRPDPAPRHIHHAPVAGRWTRRWLPKDLLGAREGGDRLKVPQGVLSPQPSSFAHKTETGPRLGMTPP